MLSYRDVALHKDTTFDITACVTFLSVELYTYFIEAPIQTVDDAVKAC